MKKKNLLVKATIISLFFLLSTVGIPSLLANSTQQSSHPTSLHPPTPTIFPGNTLYVGGSGPDNYTSIQDAIDAALDGDTIIVFSGTYLENLTIDKQLTILGEDKQSTIIEANNSGDAIQIFSDFVTIKGFTITRTNPGNFYIGIHAMDNFTTIRDTILSEVGYGIYLDRTRDNLVEDNEFVKSGLRITTTDIYDNTVENNIVNGLPLLYYDTVTDTIIDQPAGQIILLRCHNITITSQDISETATGILAVDSDDITIEDNTIRHNYRNGINLVRTENVIIQHNNINGNYDFGMYLSSTQNVDIIQNNIYMNYGGMVMEFCDLSIISENNFANNGFYVISFFGSLNSWDGNYWDRPRFFPKLIFELPRLNIDLHPADHPIQF